MRAHHEQHQHGGSLGRRAFLDAPFQHGLERELLGSSSDLGKDFIVRCTYALAEAGLGGPLLRCLRWLHRVELAQELRQECQVILGHGDLATLGFRLSIPVAPKGMPGRAVLQHDGEACHWEANGLADCRRVPNRCDDMHLDPGGRSLGVVQETLDGVGRLSIAPGGPSTCPTPLSHQWRAVLASA